MKYLTLICVVFIVALIGCTSFDEPAIKTLPQEQKSRFISNNEACEIAARAFADFEMEMPSRSSRTAFATLYRSNQSRGGNDSTFYVVNFTEGGFAVVAANRYAKEKIIGISEYGQFNEDGNECLKEYMDYAYTFVPKDSFRLDTCTTAYPAIDTVVTYIGHHLHTLWGQGYPYNKYCPVLTDGSYAAVGCVAVAMGQVLSYHRRPASINGYELNWDEMLSSTKIYYVSTQGQDDIAHLLRECGRLINMSYGTSSSAFTADVPNALKVLGFMNAEYHQDLSRCIESLRYEGPIQMRGPGHSWVTDGVKILTIKNRATETKEYQYYLRMNWGWNGSSDGYFLVKPGYYDNNVLGYNNLSYITGVK